MDHHGPISSLFVLAVALHLLHRFCDHSVSISPKEWYHYLIANAANAKQRGMIPRKQLYFCTSHEKKYSSCLV